MKPLLFLFIVLLVYNCKTTNDHSTNSEINIIPRPKEVITHEGVFQNDKLAFQLPSKWEDAGLIIQQILPNATASNDEKISNLFVIENTKMAKEAYNLSVEKTIIKIEASHLQGVIHGVQSISQLLTNKSRIEIPCMAIYDEPRFSYRGIHLDVSRHFFNVDFIKKYIDLLSKYKINNFHWHLTDDQGWRIEIKKYPLLAKKAAFRDETLIGHYSSSPQVYDGKKYGGYYTHEEVKEIVKYASDRYINIIPEIEMPGHAAAAIAAYPELGCTGKKIDVAKKWGVFDDVFCPNEVTFKFLEDVLSEVLELFPSEYIHIGGDECPKIQWKQNKLCQEIIKKENLKDEHGLQSYFIKRIEKFLNGKGRQIIGWDEILEGGLAPNATVMSWRGIEGGIAAARENHKVIMTPTDYCYFDYYQSKSPLEPLAIGGFLPLEKVYHYEPIPQKLEADKHKYIIGTQANLWTEYIDSPSKLEYMLLPRMPALAEVGWTAVSQKSYSDFLKRLQHHFIFWKKRNINFANKTGDLLYEIIAGEGKGIQLQLKNNGSSLPIKYAMGLSLSSKLTPYTKPIQVNQSCTILAATMDGEKPSGNIDTFFFKMHKAAGKKIDLLIEPSDKYRSDGKGSLINGMQGKSNNFGSEWLGFEGKNLESVIDLQKNEEIETINLRFFSSPEQWIYPPKSVTIWLSQDGSKYNELPGFVLKPSVDKIVRYDLPVAKTKAKYIKLKIENYGIIPIGKPGEGNGAWLFVDEIIVN
ncbi:MAG: Beta-hexosaminidase precursor [Bacteroidota bacterium]|jgi:hexosaminidase